MEGIFVLMGCQGDWQPPVSPPHHHHHPSFHHNNHHPSSRPCCLFFLRLVMPQIISRTSVLQSEYLCLSSLKVVDEAEASGWHPHNRHHVQPLSLAIPSPHHDHLALSLFPPLWLTANRRVSAHLLCLVISRCWNHITDSTF